MGRRSPKATLVIFCNLVLLHSESLGNLLFVRCFVKDHRSDGQTRRRISALGTAFSGRHSPLRIPERVLQSGVQLGQVPGRGFRSRRENV